MQDRKIIRKQEVAAAVAVVAEKFASNDGMDEREALQLLAHWLDASEAVAVLAILSRDRLRCRRCSRCVPESKASGAYCLPCAVCVRREEHEGDQA